MRLTSDGKEHGASERREMIHDSNARQVLIMKLAGDVGIPAHLSLNGPVGQPREAVVGRRAAPRGVDRRPRRDVAVAERHDDVRPEVGPFDGRATRQRRRNVLSQSQMVAVGRRNSDAVVDLEQPLDTPRRNYSNNGIVHTHGATPQLLHRMYRPTSFISRLLERIPTD